MVSSAPVAMSATWTVSITATLPGQDAGPRVGQLQLRIPKLRHRYMQVEAMAESTPELNANSLRKFHPERWRISPSG
jgi:hypothetical protein